MENTENMSITTSDNHIDNNHHFDTTLFWSNNVEQPSWSDRSAAMAASSGSGRHRGRCLNPAVVTAAAGVNARGREQRAAEAAARQQMPRADKRCAPSHNPAGRMEDEPAVYAVDARGTGCNLAKRAKVGGRPSRGRSRVTGSSRATTTV